MEYKTQCLHQTNLRLPVDLIKLADKLRKKLAKDARLQSSSGRAPNRSEVIRLALSIGLNTLDQVRSPVGKKR